MSATASGRSVQVDKNVIGPAASVIGAAAGIGVFSWFLVRFILTKTNVVDVLVLGLVDVLAIAPMSAVLGAGLVRFGTRQVRQLYPLLGERRRVLRYLGTVLGLWIVFLAGSVMAVTAAPGDGSATVGWALVRLLVAVLLGGGTVLMAFWPSLFGPAATRRMRWFGVFSCCWLTAGAFLFSLDLKQIGMGLLILYGYFLYRETKVARKADRRRRSFFFGAFVGLCYLVLGFVVWASMLDGTLSTGVVVKYGVEIASVVALGAVTALTIWRRSREARPIVRHIGTAATTLVPAYLLFLLLDDQLLGGAAEVALFPLVVWLGFRLWRTMLADRRIGIKAAADIVFALILGSVLVLFLIWLANLLALAPGEVQLVKTAAEATRTAIELSPWIWAGIYAVLAAAHLLGALGPAKFQAIPRRLARLRVVPSVKVVRRTTTMTGIGLMVVALLGIVVPPSIGAVLRRQIQAAYTVAAQEELRDQEEIAVYQAISAELPVERPTLIMLTELVEDVHRTEQQDKHGNAASPAELDLALRLGKLQGQVIAEQQRPPEPTGAPTPANLTGPIRDVADLHNRLDQQQQEDKLKQARDKQAETASELSANTVTSMMDLISLGHAEALAVVHEYINGLAESPLGEIFLDWTKRGLSKINPDRPPAVADVVEPDPTDLADAAQNQESEAEGRFVPSTGGGIQAAVDATHKTITVEQQEAACPSCDKPGEPAHVEPEPIEHGR